MDGTKPPGEGIRRRGMVTGHGGMATKKDLGHHGSTPTLASDGKLCSERGKGICSATNACHRGYLVYKCPWGRATMTL